MNLSNPFKLEKLKIKAFSDQGRGRGYLVGTFEAMFNPQSFTQEYKIIYGRNQGFNSTNERVNYARSKSRALNVKLLLDGTGVDTIGIARPFQKTVRERVDDFLRLCFRMNGATHEPNFLVMEWGKGLIFSCRLEKVDIAYTSFDRGGSPIRAELDITVISDKEAKKRMSEENKSSPDVTHTRIVKAGDTLPLLSKEIYGSADHYLAIARANDLDDFRELTPGREIVFPPLET